MKTQKFVALALAFTWLMPWGAASGPARAVGRRAAAYCHTAYRRAATTMSW